jgi:hypothetical protein
MRSPMCVGPHHASPPLAALKRSDFDGDASDGKLPAEANANGARPGAAYATA